MVRTCDNPPMLRPPPLRAPESGREAGATRRDDAALSALERVALVAFASALFIWFVRGGIRPVSDPDAWLHLRLGTFLNDGGDFDSLPDPWTPFAETVYVPTQWLPERLGAAVYSIAGLPGIALLRAAAALALFAALLWLCRRVADTFPATIAAAFGFVGSLGAVAERPQAAAVVLLTLTVGAWWMTVQDGRPRWWLIPLAWVHAHVHGLWFISVLVGVVFCGVVLIDAGAEWRAKLRILLVPVLSLAAAALTPLGPRLLATPFQVTGAVSQYVQEWQAVSTDEPLLVIVVAGLLTILATWVWSPSRVPPSRGLVLLAAVVCVMWSGRTIVVGSILLAGLLAESLQRHRGTPADSSPSRFEVGLWTSAFASIAVTCAVLAPIRASAPEGVPASLADPLRALGDQAILLVDHGLSGWVMWEAPETPVVFDLRSEIYAGSHIEAYVDAMAARPGWSDFVETTGTTHALVPTDSALAEALSRSEWVPQGEANGFALLSRPGS